MADSRTQNRLSSEVASGQAQPDAVIGREALNHHPSVLAARELIQEARQQVARAHQLIERGRNLRQKVEQTLQAFRKHQGSF